jgi:hypothetical protein
MSEQDRPVGKLFSHVYVDRGVSRNDSPKFRRRLAAVLTSFNDLDDGLAAMIPREIGVDVRWNGGHRWAEFFRDAELSDVFDVITIVFRYFTAKRVAAMYEPATAEIWLTEVGRMLVEENLHFSVDQAGGVHYRADQEFSAVTAAAIDGLGKPRYANARAQFEQALVALAENPVNRKQAVRCIFNAAEGIFRLMFPRAPRLGSKEAQQALEPILQRLYAQDKAALSAASKMLGSFQEWIDAAHFYRHEHGVEEPSQPPIELAIHLISTGSSYIRWLIHLDQQVVPD